MKNSYTTANFKRTNESYHNIIAVVLISDFPFKGRLLHHLRKGRLNQALSLLISGKMQLLQRFRNSGQYSILDAVQCISQLENQLKKLVLSPKGGLS